MKSATTENVVISSVRGTEVVEANDFVAVEQPLEIQLQTFGAQPVTVSITMRTPGDDLALAVGFLWGEGVLLSPDHIDIEQSYVIHVSSQVCVALKEGCAARTHLLQRNFYTTSSCGICGKSSLDLIQHKSQISLICNRPLVTAATIHELSKKVRAEQVTFDQTGGLHAAALFDPTGGLLSLREDVGRHNAVDKVIGTEILANSLPLSDAVLFLSGRTSFELVQKAAMAGIPIIAAVGAPSSLAIELAASAGITLIGFLRNGRFNIYSGNQRVVRA